MSDPTLAQQIDAVEFARTHVGRAPPKMRDSEIQEHVRRLEAAIKSLKALESVGASMGQDGGGMA